MSTWWKPARRADIGLRQEDLPVDAFTITNRGWYLLYRVLKTAGARSVDRMAEPDAYVTAALANHWGSTLVCACLDDWLQLGYASYLSSWSLVNSGRAETNYGFWFPGKENDGAAGWQPSRGRIRAIVGPGVEGNRSARGCLANRVDDCLED